MLLCFCSLQDDCCYVNILLFSSCVDLGGSGLSTTAHLGCESVGNHKVMQYTVYICTRRAAQALALLNRALDAVVSGIYGASLNKEVDEGILT